MTLAPFSHLMVLDRAAYEVKELPAVLRLGKNAVYELLRSGQLRSIRYGKKYIIPREAIVEFLNGRKA
ncbi:helix-turn-helix domain-containing protein [Deinococcus yavapaiensis]|uniref:Excisionase family DNA binding protein n=1 Tax=Deinococcus yavapaiensis KR-236 TaxID=694435 RepID=A0A318S9S9_9DEIO|nr:helix-turn-helix domain-containing protein [Deinococcus yavapaiensis]PYE55485.1 excisionase family DNA binding protein [Deinococcus yavapaiensis KR-236]